jgi:3,4-dihydroxy-2-butanone 4-phosphate synthase
MPLSRVEDLVADIRAGKMVILMDDEDRENEGDLVMAATHVRPEDINFMITHARGLVCLTLSRERCKQLNLPLMVDQNGAQHSTNFTLSIEAAEGITTGISAAERAHTIQTAVAAHANQAISYSRVIFSHSWLNQVVFYIVQAIPKQAVI